MRGYRWCPTNVTRDNIQPNENDMLVPMLETCKLKVCVVFVFSSFSLFFFLPPKESFNFFVSLFLYFSLFFSIFLYFSLFFLFFFLSSSLGGVHPSALEA
jgi:hypothetical protein